jgi:hypothetical protein
MDSINIRDMPELERLADEVRRNKRPRVLRRDNQDLAIVTPVYDQNASATQADSEGIWATYDADRVRAALTATMGSWHDLDTNRMISDLYRAREEGSRPANRP